MSSDNQDVQEEPDETGNEHEFKDVRGEVVGEHEMNNDIQYMEEVEEEHNVDEKNDETINFDVEYIGQTATKDKVFNPIPHTILLLFDMRCTLFLFFLL